MRNFRLTEGTGKVGIFKSVGTWPSQEGPGVRLEPAKSHGCHYRKQDQVLAWRGGHKLLGHPWGLGGEGSSIRRNKDSSPQ